MSAADCMRVVVAALAAALLGACASIGRPEGGPRDETPPVFLRSNPPSGATGVSRQRIDLFFDENVKLEDAQNRVVVSPAQRETPRVSANGRRVTVEIKDTLLDSTTYTIDFSDAVRDLNEGNILDGLAIDFATGAAIDTLRISGMVFQARNLEPAQGMVVGVYSNLSDTAITTLPLERVAKTNQYGQFTLRGLRPGSYRIFALDDRNHDWHWDRSEAVAFSDVVLSPSVGQVEVTDTLRNLLGEDSTVVRQGWRFLPDDVLLTWFQEDYAPQYLRDYSRTTQRQATFLFGTRQDSLPDITILNGPFEGRKLLDVSVVEVRQGLDSIVYWLRDSALVAQDSLLVEARYLKTDSAERLMPKTDTLKLYMKASQIKEREKKAREAEENREKVRKDLASWRERYDKALAKGDTLRERMPDTTALLPVVPQLAFKAVSKSPQELNLPLVFEAAEPVEFVDSGGWRLEWTMDSVWHPVADAALVQDTVLPRQYRVEHPWREGARYRFILDTLSIRNIYGEWAKPLRHDFKTKTLEEYGNLIFHISDMPDSAALVAELLNSQDAVIDTATVQSGGVARFEYVAPGTYYLRAFADRNGNGVWDTGSLSDSLPRQPEDVFYFSKKVNLRKNWDVEENWALLSLPVDVQKPQAVKKNKPKVRDKDKNKNKNKNSRYDDEEYDDEDGDGYPDDGSMFGGQGFYGNGSQYENARRNNTGAGRNRNRPAGLQRANN